MCLGRGGAAVELLCLGDDLQREMLNWVPEVLEHGEATVRLEACARGAKEWQVAFGLRVRAKLVRRRLGNEVAHLLESLVCGGRP